MQEELVVHFKLLHEDAVMPSYSKDGDAGLDLTAISKTYDDKDNTVYGTGIAVAIPKGYVGLLFPRSSISKTKLVLSNSVGVIDSGYRGEIILKFIDADVFISDQDIYQVGDRIGQLIILPYPKVQLLATTKLPESERGDSGFGSTGN